MKKFLVTILALVYITTSSGAVFHMHYCMGQLADWGLGHNQSKTCSKCGMAKSDEKDNECCKDENKLIKNDSDQKAAEAGFQLIQLFGESLPIVFIEISFNDFPLFKEVNSISHAPPRSYGVAMYIRNGVFLI